MTYDDLLTRLDDTLKGPGGEAAAARLRERYRVVLVDEFQDTDPVQWDIMRRAFGDGGATLVLIGDPKQAIYAFRGADVYAYLEAASRGRHARDARGQLAQRPGPHRRLRRAVRRRQARARGHRLPQGPRRRRQPDAAAQRRARRRRRCASASSTATSRRSSSRAAAASSNAVRARARRQGPRGRPRARCSPRTPRSRSARRTARRSAASAIRPGHVAVLVRTHRNAALIRDALDEVDIPAVINGAGSVFGTAPARDWLRLLEAIERPSSPRARRLGRADPLPRLDDRAGRVRRRRGPRGAPPPPAPVGARAARQGRRLADRDRHAGRGPARARARRPSTASAELTDLRHVGQLLHAAATTEQMGAAALTVVAAPADRRGRRGHERRGAQPAPGVRRRGGPGPHHPPQQGPRVPDRLLPVPVGAGLDPRRRPAGLLPRPATPATSASSTSAWTAPTSPRHQRQHEAEQRGEDLRLAYVALTRAQHQAVVWWARLVGQPQLGARPAAVRPRRRGQRAADGPRDADRRGGRRALRGARRRGARVHQRRARRRSACRPRGRASRASRRELCAAALRPRPRLALAAHVLQRHHRRRLRGAGGERARGARRRRRGADRRAAGRRAAATTTCESAALRGVPSLLADDAGRRRRSAPSCTACFEATDFAAPDLDAELGDARRRRRWRAGASTSATRRRSSPGLRAAIETPLGPLLGGRALRDLERADRLDELSFELPLVGGDEPTGRADARRDRRACCASTSRRATRSPATPSASTTRPAPEPARLPHRQHRPRRRAPTSRFAVVDYKTNWLGAPGRGADRLAPPPGRARRPRCSTPTTRCRRCSTPSRCTATCAGGCPATTPSATSPASSTSSCAG